LLQRKAKFGHIFAPTRPRIVGAPFIINMHEQACAGATEAQRIAARGSANVAHQKYRSAKGSLAFTGQTRLNARQPTARNDAEGRHGP
jgi:hypothetical protein